MNILIRDDNDVYLKKLVRRNICKSLILLGYLVQDYHYLGLSSECVS